MAINRNTDTLSGGAPPNGPSATTSSVSSAALLAMLATPVGIVPAPGRSSGVPSKAPPSASPAGTAYAGIAAGEDLAVEYTNQAGAEVGSAETTGFLDQATAQTQHIAPRARPRA